MKESLLHFQKLLEKYQRWVKPWLNTEENLKEQIYQLKEMLRLVEKAFSETGSFSFCAKCAKSGVICCGEGLEWKLSEEEFYLNLFLLDLEEKNLELTLPFSRSCLFLGPAGCSLPLPPLFCRNFFCTELQEFLGRKNLILLQNVLGPQTVLSFKLSEKIKALLHKKGLESKIVKESGGRG